MEISNLIGTTQELAPVMQLFMIMTVLMFLPTIIFMMTSFVRIIVSFSFIKSALGVTQTIPNQVLIGLAICLTIFIMSPTISDINETALKPYFEKTITVDEALDRAEKPIREFLLKQTRDEDIKLFAENSPLVDKDKDITEDNVPLHILIPAFAISELKTAFSIGFLIYIPFIVIDLVVSSTLMSMGMFMLPPASVSLPFKLLLFIMTDGWNLLVKSLIMSFN